MEYAEFDTEELIPPSQGGSGGKGQRPEEGLPNGKALEKNSIENVDSQSSYDEFMRDVHNESSESELSFMGTQELNRLMGINSQGERLSQAQREKPISEEEYLVQKESSIMIMEHNDSTIATAEKENEDDLVEEEIMETMTFYAQEEGEDYVVLDSGRSPTPVPVHLMDTQKLDYEAPTPVSPIPTLVPVTSSPISQSQPQPPEANQISHIVANFFDNVQQEKLAGPMDSLPKGIETLQIADSAPDFEHNRAYNFVDFSGGSTIQQYFNSYTQAFQPEPVEEVEYELVVSEQHPVNDQTTMMMLMDVKMPEKESKVSGYNTRAQSRRLGGTSHHDPLPFACATCGEKFAKKLQLNNHTEKRHGIKFVFTERGKKVKLVRMPEEHLEGEKLDPCVAMLIKQNKEISKNVLGVAELSSANGEKAHVGGVGINQTTHEMDPMDVIKHGNLQVNGGILVPTLKFFTVKNAHDRGQTPFVAYQPWGDKGNKYYLLAIEILTPEQQLLVPATQADLVLSKNVSKVIVEEVTHAYSEESQRPGPSSRLAPLPTLVPKEKYNFENIAIVGVVKPKLDETNGQFILEVNTPPPTEELKEKISFISHDCFVNSLFPTKPKVLRCLAAPPKVGATIPTAGADVGTSGQNIEEAKPEAKKRAYTRRSNGRRNKTLDEAHHLALEQLHDRSTRLLLENQQTQNETTPLAQAENVDGGPTGGKKLRKRKKLNDSDWTSSDEDAFIGDDDEEYVPEPSHGKRGEGSRGTGRNSRVGRPRKLDFESFF